MIEPRAERGVNITCLWIVVIMTNVLLSSLPHFLMLLKPDSPPENVTLHLSSIVHRPYPDNLRLIMKDEARRMFYWGYSNYINYAFPEDELDPIHCRGRGHDWDHPSNININDILGDYSLTLIESLGTLAIMGDVEEFKRAVAYISTNVTFNNCATVQIFEATIRILGSLLSAHLIITDPQRRLGDFAPKEYNNELLHLAHDLATRLLPAFENTTTGLPHPRVNLCHGVPPNGIMETCTAGAGTLVVEFSLLSRLLEDPIYESLARKAVRILWDHRHPRTGLVGNVIDLHSGNWVGQMSGIGAGIDSFYEYLLKSYILYGEREDIEMFTELYKNVMKYLRKGSSCVDLLLSGSIRDLPIYVNVGYSSGKLFNYWFDSLSASFAGLQVLAGDIDEAICTHALYYTLWRKYEALPERYDWRAQTPVVSFYPLRPELVESTYLLYQATQNPFYLHVGTDILNSLEKHTRAKCGYATLHDVRSKTQEDRMESFFLSETCKYLYLLFDTEHVINTDASNYMFTTEGHVLRVDPKLRQKPWDDNSKCWYSNVALERVNETKISSSCHVYNNLRRHFLPLSRNQFTELEHIIGLYNHQ